MDGENNGKPWKMPMKMDDLGVPGTTIFGNTQIKLPDLGSLNHPNKRGNGSTSTDPFVFCHYLEGGKNSACFTFCGVCATFQQPPVAHWRLLFLQISCLILRGFRTQRHHEASEAPKSVWEPNFYLQRGRMAKPIKTLPYASGGIKLQYFTCQIKNTGRI